MRIWLRVIPKSAHAGVDGIVSDARGAALKVRVTSAPERGRANAALLKLLAREWAVRQAGSLWSPARARGARPCSPRAMRRRCCEACALGLNGIMGSEAEGGARLIDGKAMAAEMRARLAARVSELKARHGLTPGLAVVLVGDDPASAIYVRNKGKAAAGAGMAAADTRLPADASEEAVLAEVARLNADTHVHGILVQLPLPAHIDAARVVAAIDPDKDVDGLHVVSAGRLATGQPGLVPCTPTGCLLMIRAHAGPLPGQRALVVGRSNLVGKPLAALLLGEHCTVTIAHSRTRELAAECRRADILVAAIGRPELVRGDWIKPGAVVIDVGINRVAAGAAGRLVGDVAFAEARAVAAAITPVPGGVGPMTIACLLENTFTAACAQNRIEPPAAPTAPAAPPQS